MDNLILQELEQLFQELEIHLSQLKGRSNQVGRQYGDIAHSILEIVPQSSNSQVCDLLIQYLQTASHEITRSTAAEALGKMRDEAAIAPLSDVLSNKKEEREVRSEAALALGRIGSNAIVPILIETLRNKDNGLMVMWHCADALNIGHFNDPFVVDALIEALIDDYTGIKDSSDIREAAKDALVAIGNDYTVRRLIEKLAAKPLNPVLYKDEGIRQDIIIALGHIPNPLSLSPLFQILNNSNRTVLQEAAIEALANFDDPRVIPAIRAASNSPNESVREMAKLFLKKIEKRGE
jgi:HEAT repeat protein